MAMDRTGQIERKTAETEVELLLTLDGTGQHEIDTEVPQPY